MVELIFYVCVLKFEIGDLFVWGGGVLFNACIVSFSLLYCYFIIYYAHQNYIYLINKFTIRKLPLPLKFKQPTVEYKPKIISTARDYPRPGCVTVVHNVRHDTNRECHDTLHPPTYPSPSTCAAWDCSLAMVRSRTRRSWKVAKRRR